MSLFSTNMAISETREHKALTFASVLISSLSIHNLAEDRTGIIIIIIII